MVPGLDMFRLFIFRLYRRKSPFKGDLKHLHHLIKAKYENIITVNFIISLFYIIPFIFLFSGVKTYIILAIYSLIYAFTIINLQKKN